MTLRHELGFPRKSLPTNSLRISFAGQDVFGQNIHFPLNG